MFVCLMGFHFFREIIFTKNFVKLISRKSYLFISGMRHSLPNSRIMIHQPSGGAYGQATDIQIQAEEIIKLKRQLNEIYVKHTGKDLASIEASMERDNFMSPQQAKEFGLIDKILERPTEPITDDQK